MATQNEGEPGRCKPSPAAVNKAAQELIRLMAEQSRESVPTNGLIWDAYGFGMLCRIADGVRSALLLTDHGQVVDASGIARVVYEAVIKYCWIAIDPSIRIARWQADATHWNRKLYHDAAEFGIEIFSPDQLDADKGEALPNMAQLASEVDDHWGGRIEGFPHADASPTGLVTLRGLYLPLYRTLSESVHTRPEVIDAYLNLSPGMWSVGPTAAEDSFWLPIVVTLLAQALLVSHCEAGWPDPDRVRAINNAMYGVS